VGYDVEFIQLPMSEKVTFPVSATEAARLRQKAVPFADARKLRSALLDMRGCRPGPDDSIDFMGQGLSYARLFIRESSVHVENNCSAPELLRLHETLAACCSRLVIHDMQSGQLHDPGSFTEWWSRPLQP
jgi:hypothetical protein